jgi:biopolymer transport protein ExbB
VFESVLEFLLQPYQAVLDLLDGGGWWVQWIFLAGVIMWTLIIERYWYFSRVLPKEAARMLKEWNARSETTSWSARQIRWAMISRLNAGMTANMPLMRVLVPLSPLLGLIGTVSGMLTVFDAMALRGSADARTMANGVSEAMICTLTGLAVSITGLYPAYYFQARAKSETELLADHFEF